jgi:hypothetical protein
MLATGGMLLLVYALVQSATVGWGTTRTIGELAAAVIMLGAFVANEQRHRNPLAPLSIFRINGLGYSNVTQLIAFAGFLAVFFYLTLYMQNVSATRRSRPAPPTSRCASRSGSPQASHPSCSPASGPGR